MAAGGKTCFKEVASLKLGDALGMERSQLPDSWAAAAWCDNYDFRCGACARTWSRPHAQDNLMCAPSSARGARLGMSSACSGSAAAAATVPVVAAGGLERRGLVQSQDWQVDTLYRKCPYSTMKAVAMGCVVLDRSKMWWALRLVLLCLQTDQN